MCIDRPGLMDRPEEAWRWVQEGLWGSLVGGGGAGSLQTEDAVASICRFLLHSLGSGVWSE